jgi:signal transduction histidine kinase
MTASGVTTPSSARILVVDDDDAGRYVKAHTLARQGYTVAEAGLAEEAFNLVGAWPPDLILLDVRLPDSDGIELCRRLKKAYPHVTIMQTSSALISAQDRTLALDAGADSYLIEPIEPDELVAVVRALLRMRQAEQALRHMNETLEARVIERTGELAEYDRRLASEQAGRRQVEDILWHTQKLEAVGRLTGGIAHDFNNLLTIITGNLELLQVGFDTNQPQPAPVQRQSRLIDAALKAAEHGAQMTQQLLAFARRSTLHAKTVDLGATIANMQNFLRRTLGDAVTIEFDISPELWPCRVDPVQFEAAILNVAINARDAMPGGGRLRMELNNVQATGAEGVAPGPYVRIRLADDGVGMDHEVAERAFEPFFTTKEIGRGSGLGLSQVYGFVSQSGGDVKIVSAPGEGTTVSLYLPRTDNPADDQDPGSVNGAQPVGVETILIVEDDEQVRDVAIAMIEDLGYKVLVARDGVEALRLLQCGKPIDLLFSDILMPNGINGFALATQARAIRAGLKILLTSGYPARGDAEVRRPDFPIIEKPYRRDKLALMLRTALEMSRGLGGSRLETSADYIET